MNRENINNFKNVIPDSVGSPDDSDHPPGFLMSLVELYKKENPAVFIDNPDLAADIQHLIFYETPEVVQDHFNDKDFSSEDKETVYRIASETYRSIKDALDRNLITDVTLKSEIEKRLTRLSFYLGVYKQE